MKSIKREKNRIELLFVMKILLMFAILVITGLVLLMAAYLLPVSRINEHISDYYLNESAVCYWMPFRPDTKVDIYTDSIMLLEAEDSSEGSVLYKSLTVPRLTADQLEPVDVFYAYHSGQALDFYEISYARYWHGYLIFLKPLLFLVSFADVKYIIVAVQLALFTASVLLIALKKGARWVLPLFLTYLFLNPVSLALSFQYNAVFMITWIQILLFLLTERKYEDFQYWILHFFVAGCVTSYFDFFTYPIVSFGVPFVLMSALHYKDFKDGLMKLVFTAGFWLSGYAGMWGAKWIITTIFTNVNVLSDAWSAAVMRSDDAMLDGQKVGPVHLILDQILVQPLYLQLTLVVLLISLLYMYRKRRKCNVSVVVLSLISGILPFIWYLLTPNHSWIHYWMTYRDLSVTVCALGTVSAALIGADRQKPDNKTEANLN